VVAAAAVPLSANAFARPKAALCEFPATEPFWGKHQGGIATPIQRHTYFMAFDVTTAERPALIALLKAWTEAAAQMTQSAAHMDEHADPQQAPADPGATLGLPASRLTITFGFGPTLFNKDGVDRFGIGARRPAALADLPRFAGDQLIAEKTGGDLSVQASADDAQVVEYAVRRMVSLAQDVATIKWAQNGFTAGFKPNETPRNQMGFKDGTINVPTTNPTEMNKFVWAGDEGPEWMRDGSYMVIRPIRIALEHWDKMTLGFQEETIGRHKLSGAPIGKQHEFDKLDLDAADKDGNPLINENAHARLSAPESNDGAQILRRAFNYDNGVMKIAERWPPWRQLTTFDAGLLFQCYQHDPRAGFTKMFEKMSKFDMLNQFTTHIGSGLFACPPGAQPGEFVGQKLFA
jgi:deferrochelatase/peroxidase EfeB